MRKEDFKQNKHYIVLSINYSLILALVYGYWMYRVDMPIWSYILVAVGFILGGVAVALISTYVKAKKSNDLDSETIS